MNSQQLILDRIAAAFPEDGDILLIRDTEYINTGTLRTLDADTLHQIASVSYNFKKYVCHFGPVKERVATLWYDDPHTGTASWVKRSIPELVDTVVTHLKGATA